MTSEDRQREDEKRERTYDPILRWRHIQEAITFAEANMPAHLRRNVPRVPKWNPPASSAQIFQGKGIPTRKHEGDE
jgi:hypothetical protein